MDTRKLAEDTCYSIRFCIMQRYVEGGIVYLVLVTNVQQGESLLVRTCSNYLPSASNAQQTK